MTYFLKKIENEMSLSSLSLECRGSLPSVRPRQLRALGALGRSSSEVVSQAPGPVSLKRTPSRVFLESRAPHFSPCLCLLWVGSCWPQPQSLSRGPGLMARVKGVLTAAGACSGAVSRALPGGPPTTTFLSARKEGTCWLTGAC